MNSGRLYAGYAKALRRARGARLRTWVRLWGGHVGARLELERGVLVRWGPHAGLDIGDDVYVGRGVVVDVPHGASLRVGRGCKVMHYTVVAAVDAISIGADTQIAEHCSVRDYDHGTAAGSTMMSQAGTASPVQIGSDVWVGRGAAVLRGAALGDGCVVGANSVVRAPVEPGTVVVGAPARPVKLRA
jgi:acetyltransferase-like isoleucine patch superfamily enzyme